MKRILFHLLEPRSIILGFTVFYFGLTSSMWIRSEIWDYRDYHRAMFVATLLLISAGGLALNRVWSNLLAAIMSGQLPFVFLSEFWMLAKNAELAIFSFQHIKTWLDLLSSAGFTPFLWLNLSIVILSYSVVSILSCRTDVLTFGYLHK